MVLTENDQGYILNVKLLAGVKGGENKLLKNLKRALDDKNISFKAYAAVLGTSEKTVWNKINEETTFSYPEVRKTKTELLPEYDTDYLFASDGNVRSDEKGA